MFYCVLHNWFSSEEPCPACHPVKTFTSTTGVFNEAPVDTVVKDWEIISFIANDFALCGYLLTKNADGTYGHYESIEQDLLSSSAHSIHSVRRLSDNKVFTIGDKVCDKYSHYEFIIEKFRIDSVGKLRVENAESTLFLESIQKPYPTPPKERIEVEEPKMFTKQDLEDAFNAGRKERSNFRLGIEPFVYATFQAYLNHIKQ